MVRSGYVMGYCSMASTVISTLVVFSLSIFGSFERNLFPAHSHLWLYHMVSLYFPTFWACSAFFYQFNFARNRSFFAAKFRSIAHFNSVDTLKGSGSGTNNHHHPQLHSHLSVSKLKPPSSSRLRGITVSASWPSKLGSPPST